MWRAFAPLLPIVALAGCGPSDRPNSSEEAMANFTLTSDAFQDGARIPTEYSCDGADISPALSWSDPPAATQSFALVMDDPDAPSGVFGHWAAYNIGPEAREFERGAGSAAGGGGGAIAFEQGLNGFGNAGYGGPCPPEGHGSHRYRFKLYALDVRALTELGEEPSVGDIEQAAQQHRIDLAELTGTYERG